MTSTTTGCVARTTLNKVPEVTIFFWIIKILATTVGETAADNLATNLGLGLTGTTWVMSAVLVVVLFFQFRLRRYVPLVYWLAVVLLSIVGTLIPDNLTDKYNVALATTTTIFAITLAIVFLAWYLSERTLSIHTIFTTRREAFYWLAILFTFAFGTAAGDYLAETLNLGYWKSAVLFGGAIALITFAWRYLHLNAVLPSGSPTSSPARSAPHWATTCHSPRPTVGWASGRTPRRSSPSPRSSRWWCT